MSVTLKCCRSACVEGKPTRVSPYVNTNPCWRILPILYERCAYNCLVYSVVCTQLRIWKTKSDENKVQFKRKILICE